MTWGVLIALLPLGGPVAGAEWEAPPEERARTSPITVDEGTLLTGRALYQKHCASCHGDKGKGDGPQAAHSREMPGDLTDPELQARLRDGEILWKITTGLREGPEIIMPSVAKKVPSEADRWKLVAFVRTLAAKH